MGTGTAGVVLVRGVKQESELKVERWKGEAKAR